MKKIVPGVHIGLISAYFRGKADGFIMRLMDALVSFPLWSRPQALSPCSTARYTTSYSPYTFGLLDRSPILSIAPGLAVFLMVLAFNLEGDAARDVLDPRMR